jgi:glucokinase
VRYVGGLDFGGTSVKMGIVDERGEIVGREVVAIDPAAGFSQVMSSLVVALRGCVRRSGVTLSAIGAGTPGFSDKETGVLVEGCRNIPNLQGNSIGGYLSREFGVPAVVDNDATSAAAGELIFGVGRRFRSFVLITLGTGIGGGIVLDGRVYRGVRGFAGEIGHMCLDPNGLWCNCGSRGCFEQYASAPAIARLYLEKLRKRGREVADTVTARDVFDAAARGESVAADVIDAAGRRIAQAFGTLLNILNVEACVIGGGVSQAGEAIVAPVSRHLADYCWPLVRAGVQIVLAELRNDAGVLGAAAGALERTP